LLLKLNDSQNRRTALCAIQVIPTNEYQKPSSQFVCGQYVLIFCNY